MGLKGLRFISALAIILCISSCGDDDGIDFYYSSGCGINSAYTGFYVVTLNITATGDQCDPGEIPPTPTQIKFGDVTTDGDCDLCFDSLGLLGDQTVLIDFWGDLRDDQMRLVTAEGDIISFFVVDFEDGDAIWGIFWWDVTSDCVVEGTFTVIIT